MRRSVCFLTLATLMVASGAMAGPKVDVCHIPPGNPDNAHAIGVARSAAPAHLAHGDTLVGPEVCDGIDNNCDGLQDEGFWQCECVGINPQNPQSACGDDGIGGDRGDIDECLPETRALFYVCGANPTVPHGWECQPMDGLGPVLGDADQGEVCF